MNTESTPSSKSSFFGRIHWSAWGLLLVAAIMLIIDHWAHVLGWLPFLLILACPLLHVFMHGKHGHGGGAHDHHASKGPGADKT